jgi:hypothetical protein
LLVCDRQEAAAGKKKKRDKNTGDLVQSNVRRTGERLVRVAAKEDCASQHVHGTGEPDNQGGETSTL